MGLTAGQTFGVNAGTSAVSAGFGILSSYLSNKWARENAEHDREENYRYNEMSADAADARTRALYTDLYSPKAQLQQLKDAGLSPSVFYANGAGGISGQSGAQGEGASGVRQDTFGIPNITPLDMSQIELNKAQARNLNADASIKEGSTDEQIKSWYLNNKNQELRNTYMQWEVKIKEIEANLKEKYGEEEITTNLHKLCEETQKLIEETRSAHVTANVNEQTQKEQIEFIKKKVLNIVADTELERSQKKLNESNIQLNHSQMHSLLMHTLIDYQNMRINKESLELDKKKLNAQVKQWGIENGFTTASHIEAIVNMILNFNLETKKTLAELVPF